MSQPLHLKAETVEKKKKNFPSVYRLRLNVKYKLLFSFPLHFCTCPAARHADEWPPVNKAEQRISIRYWNKPKKCFSSFPPRRPNHQWHEKEMRYWYSYETNVLKHATSSAQQDEILNIHLAFRVITELQLGERGRGGQLKALMIPALYGLFFQEANSFVVFFCTVLATVSKVLFKKKLCIC